MGKMKSEIVGKTNADIGSTSLGLQLKTSCGGEPLPEAFTDFYETRKTEHPSEAIS